MTAAEPFPCPPWCTVGSHEEAHDVACWGCEQSDRTEVPLSLEEGYPTKVVPERLRALDPPRLGAYAYREEPGYHEVVYVHMYRPSENDHLNVDTSVNLTANEAVQFATALLNAVEEIAGMP